MEEKTNKMPRLTVSWTDANGEKNSRDVTAYPCVIGRRGDCDLVIADPSISGHHATLEYNEATRKLVLRDNNSTNGLQKMGEPRVESIAIPDAGIELRMGNLDVSMYFAADDNGAEDKTPLAVKPTLVNDAATANDTVSHVPQAAAPTAAPLASAWSDASAPKENTASPLMGDFSRAYDEEENKTIICPHCWHRFSVEDFLFISRHQSLIGDPVLGADAQLRFLPSRFTAEGTALDAGGVSCPDKACPRCHLRIPPAASEMPPLFLSIVGATASGKSYFLTSLAWDLRNTLLQNFSMSFTDTDAASNQILNDFEETLYLHSDPNELVALRKTELQGELYNQVFLDNMLINLPKPFMFTMVPAEHHPKYAEAKKKMSRTLVLYDNAGEHFEPSMDSVDNPTTQHLLHSDTVFFLFDPTKDVRFRRYLQDSGDPQVAPTARVQRQEIILTEMINRINKYSGAHAKSKNERTMMVLVSKFDIWKHMLDMELPEEPWTWIMDLNTCALDIDLIKNVSFQVRQLLERLCPEVVTTVENFAGNVVYFPNSALGHSPELMPDTGIFGIRPMDIHPIWISVPMLYFLYQRGVIPSIPEEYREHHECTKVASKRLGDVYFVMLPGERKPIQVPVSFAGYELRYPGTDVWFKVGE